MDNGRNQEILVLFDVDGTLTKPRNPIDQTMINSLKQLKKKHYIAIVGGSDLNKIQEQIGKEFTFEFDFVFSENGLLSFKEGKEIHRQSLKDHLGEARLQKLLNFTLRELSNIELPVKRGTFIEYRNGMLNISPVGRNCSQKEREDYEKYDLENSIRKNLIAKLENEFKDLNLKYSIGGQISFDVFPIGWDKTYCLQFLDEFKQIYFFGDKTFEGGNDFEIYTHERTLGFTVKEYTDTIKYLNELFLQKQCI